MNEAVKLIGTDIDRVQVSYELDNAAIKNLKVLELIHTLCDQPLDTAYIRNRYFDSQAPLDLMLDHEENGIVRVTLTMPPLIYQI